MRPRRLAFAAALTLAFAASAAPFLATPARACQTCQCGAAPPTTDCVGCEEPGTFFGGAEWAHQSTSEGVAGVDEVAVDGHTVRFSLGWIPLERLRLALDLPLVHRRAQLVSGSDHVGFGLGDPTLSGQYHIGAGPLAALSLVAAVRFPAAPELRTASGEPLDLDAQVGTGAFVVFAGLEWSDRFGRWRPTARALAFVPSHSRFGFEPAAGGLFHAGVSYELLDWFEPGLALDARVEGVERSGGVREPSSGGEVVFVSPSLRFAITDQLGLYAEGRLPVVTALRGAQWEGPIVLAGVGFELGGGDDAPAAPSVPLVAWERR